jgi:hypothetical protein
MVLRKDKPLGRALSVVCQSIQAHGQAWEQDQDLDPRPAP